MVWKITPGPRSMRQPHLHASPPDSGMKRSPTATASHIVLHIPWRLLLRTYRVSLELFYLRMEGHALNLSRQRNWNSEEPIMSWAWGHTCDPSTWETEEGGLLVPSWPEPHTLRPLTQDVLLDVTLVSQAWATTAVRPGNQLSRAPPVPPH